MEDSLFGQLPPELRNTVYNLALPTPGNITIDIRRHQPQPPLDEAQKDYWALASTCKGIWQESMSLFLAQNSVDVIITPRYLGAGGFACSPPLLRPRALDEMQTWLKLFGTCTAGGRFNVVVGGKLSFLLASSCSLSVLEDTARWLNKVLESSRAGLANAAQLSVTLWLPLKGVQAAVPEVKTTLALDKKRSSFSASVGSGKGQACVNQLEESDVAAAVPERGFLKEGSWYQSRYMTDEDLARFIEWFLTKAMG